jgi:CHAT domain-containing protein
MFALERSSRLLGLWLRLYQARTLLDTGRLANRLGRNARITNLRFGIDERDGMERRKEAKQPWTQRQLGLFPCCEAGKGIKQHRIAAWVALFLLGTIGVSGCGWVSRRDGASDKPAKSPASQSPLKNTRENLYSKAEFDYQQGRLEAARTESESGYREFLKKIPELAGKFQLLRVLVMLEQGDLPQNALAELSAAPLSVFSSCDAMARKHMLEAVAYSRLGDQSKVERSMKEAERPCANAEPSLAADLATRRGAYLDDWVLAEEDFRAALKISREQHDQFREAGALLNLSHTQQILEHYDESVEFGQASVNTSRKNGYKLYENRAEGNVAIDLYKLGDFDRSLSLLSEVEASAVSLGLKRDEMIWRNFRGLVLEQTGQFSLAAAEYRQALAMANQLRDQDQATYACVGLAFVSLEIGNWQEAAYFSQQGREDARLNQNRPMELAALLVQGQIASHNRDERTAERLLAEVAHDPGHDRQSLRWEAQVALANIYATEHKLPAANAEYQVALNTVRDARCSVYQESLRMPFFANTTRVYSSYIDFLVQQGKAAEALKIADESRALTLAEGLGIEGKKCLASETNFNPQRASRDAQATILFYWLGAEHSYLWAVTPDRVQTYPLPPAAQIDLVVQTYSKALVGSRDVLRSGDPTGSSLYQTLVAPAEQSLLRGQRVIVIADGSLSGLNFETLINPKPQPHYWIEDVCVENASSLRLLAAGSGKHVRPGGGRLLLIGNPQPPAEGGFELLPNAAREMQSVQKYFSGDEVVFEKAGSTPTAYLGSHPEQFAYIHFVAHGVASLTDPLDSAVVLSPTPVTSPSQGSDAIYKLYAREIMTRPLKADLVTVSTCKGAGVRSYTGEGLVGLSWAFLHAGAHHVIGALWDVSDESTPQLMAAMYAELVKGSPPEEALRAAKLSLLHLDSPFHKPYYWAPFQLYTGF